jgi:hypothetical protein
VQLLDDLTGEPAGETVGFALDGIDYDIDLSFANAEALRTLLQRYADAGRRTGGRKQRPRIVPGAKKTKTAKPVAGRRAAAATKTAKAPAKAAAAKKAAPVKAVSKTATAKAAPAPKTASAKAAPKAAHVKAATTPVKAVPKAATTTAKKPVRKAPPVTFSAAQA